MRQSGTFCQVPITALQNCSLIPSVEILKRSWGDQCVVYLTKSRQTHLLSAHSAYVLEFLEQGPVPFEELRDRLQLFAGDVDGEDVASLAHEIVDTLSRIGIIEILEDAS